MTDATVTDTTSNVVPMLTTKPKVSAADKAKAKALAKKAAEKRAKALAAKADRDNEKALSSLTMPQALLRYLDASGRAQGLARVMWHKIAEEVGMKDWHTLTNANARGNERAVYDRLEVMRKEVQTLAKTKGLVNIDAPWKGIKDIGRGLNKDSVTRVAKGLDTRQKLALTTLYKAGMKEERPTPEELEVNRMIGQILRAAFKIDLSTLG